jgi:hypothetical protein
MSRAGSRESPTYGNLYGHGQRNSNKTMHYNLLSLRISTQLEILKPMQRITQIYSSSPYQSVYYSPNRQHML